MVSCGQTEALGRNEGKGWTKYPKQPQPGNPAICMLVQTGDFASPSHDGFALKQIMGNVESLPNIDIGRW